MTDLSALRPIKDTTEFEKAVASMIASKFDDYALFGVVEERRLYTPQTVKYIWEQNKGLTPHVVEVSYNGEYLCDVASDMQPDEALALIQMRLIKLISTNVKDPTTYTPESV